MDAATEATRSLQGLSAELTARVPQLLEAMRTVGAGLDLHLTLDRIVQTAAELADARYAAIGIIDDAGEGLTDFVTYGVTGKEHERIGALPDGHKGLLGALIHDPEPLRLAGLTQDSRSAGFPPGHPSMRTFLGMPVRVQCEIFGNLYLTKKRGGGEFVAVSADDPTGILGTQIPPDSPVGTLATPRSRGARPFTDAERTLATQFAAQAALALVLADAQRDRERLAVYEDRDRIARDLHDLVIQRLFATGMMLESAQRRSVVPEVARGVGKAVDELDTTIQEIRTAIFALQQGPTEAPSGLRTRVLREIGTAAVPLGFQPAASFIGPVDSRVGELTGKNLLAALREALSNAFRHARATRIEVVVDATVRLPDGIDGVRLTVADDGIGIPDGGRRSGLKNLAKRAESLGGSCPHGPGLGADGAGTMVRWEAPL